MTGWDAGSDPTQVNSGVWQTGVLEPEAGGERTDAPVDASTLSFGPSAFLT